MNATPMVLFFGCLGDVGHYLHHADGYRLYDASRKNLKCPFEGALDSTFAPPFVNQRDDVTALTHIHGWTVLAMWDRSIDKRPGSNAAFLVPGTHTEAFVWEAARAVFPQVVSRLKAAPVLAVDDGAHRITRGGSPKQTLKNESNQSDALLAAQAQETTEKTKED